MKENQSYLEPCFLPIYYITPNARRIHFRATKDRYKKQPPISNGISKTTSTIDAFFGSLRTPVFIIYKENKTATTVVPTRKLQNPTDIAKTPSAQNNRSKIAVIFQIRPFVRSCNQLLKLVIMPFNRVLKIV